MIIINQVGVSTTLNFVPHGHQNLMELIVNELYEDIGACKGKAWCGTCHGVVVQGVFDKEEIFGDELKTLRRLVTEPQSRLACQIMLEPELDGMIFKIIGDN
jgi:ferredoxin